VRPTRSPSWRAIARRPKRPFAGDIIGLHNHGTITSATRSPKRELASTGIPNFAPELFRRAVLKESAQDEGAVEGLSQLCEEGATQVFKPMRNNDMNPRCRRAAAVRSRGVPLEDEYSVNCVFDGVNVAHRAVWVSGDDAKAEEFRIKSYEHLAVDLRTASYISAIAREPSVDARTLAGSEVQRNARISELVTRE